MSSRDCCKDGTSRPDFDPKRNFMGQPWLDHEDSTPPLSYLDQASAAPLFGHAPGVPGLDAQPDRADHPGVVRDHDGVAAAAVRAAGAAGRRLVAAPAVEPAQEPSQCAGRRAAAAAAPGGNPAMSGGLAG